MAALDKRDLELGNLIAKPISLLGCVIAAKDIKDVEPDWFNPYEPILYEQEAKKQLSPKVAQDFLDLLAEGKVPGWVISQADIKLIKAAAR